MPTFAANLDWLFTERPFAQRFELAAAAGFTAVEFPVPYRYRPAELVGWLAAAGLRQVLINTPVGAAGTDLAWGDAGRPDQLQEFRRGLRRALDYAAAMGTPLVHVMAGACPDESSRPLALRTYRDNLAWAAEQAATADVTLVLEPISRHACPRYVLNSVELAVAVVRDLGRENVRVLLDVYHAAMNDEDPLTSVTMTAPVLGHVQIADVPGRHEPGTGRIDWPALLAQLTEVGYTGWVGCEFAPTGTTEPALAFRDTLTPAGEYR